MRCIGLLTILDVLRSLSDLNLSFVSRRYFIVYYSIALLAAIIGVKMTDNAYLVHARRLGWGQTRAEE